MTTIIGSLGALPETLTKAARQSCASGNVVADPVSIDTPSPTQQEIPFPEQIKIWPQMVMSAAQQKLGGAIRVWTFAKALDESGSGVADKDSLLAYMKYLGVPTANRYRWLRSATQSRLLRPVRNGDRVLICGIDTAGRLISAKDIGQRCEIPACFLSGHHWKSKVWDLILTQFKNQPVSRASLSQITGVPIRTQIELERFGQVAVNRNWCLMQTDPKNITPCIEFAHPHAFVARIGDQSCVARQLPNNYTVPSRSGTPDGGSYRNNAYIAASAFVNSDSPESPRFSIVRSQENTFPVEGARCGRIYRLYFDQPKPLKRTARRLGNVGIHTPLFERLVVEHSRKGNTWYLERGV